MSSNSQAKCKLNDVDQADVPLTPLDATHVIPVQLRQLGQLLLRQIALLSQSA
jgi:hypothetical protein